MKSLFFVSALLLSFTCQAQLDPAEQLEFMNLDGHYYQPAVLEGVQERGVYGYYQLPVGQDFPELQLTINEDGTTHEGILFRHAGVEAASFFHLQTTDETGVYKVLFEDEDLNPAQLQLVHDDLDRQEFKLTLPSGEKHFLRYCDEEAGEELEFPAPYTDLAEYIRHLHFEGDYRVETANGKNAKLSLYSTGYIDEGIEGLNFFRVLEFGGFGNVFFFGDKEEMQRYAPGDFTQELIWTDKGFEIHQGGEMQYRFIHLD